MKLYLLEDKQIAAGCRQLISLHSECSTLRWSKSLTDIPEDVLNAASTLELFAQSTIEKHCCQENLFAELSDEEEAAMFALLRKTPLLKKTLGSCVVLAGTEAREVRDAIVAEPLLITLHKSLSLGKNLVIF